MLAQLGVSVQEYPQGYVIQGGQTFARASTAPAIDLGHSFVEVPLLFGLARMAGPGSVTFAPMVEMGPDWIKDGRSLMDAWGLPYRFDIGAKALTITAGPIAGGRFRLPPGLEAWTAPLLMIAPLAEHPVLIEMTIPGHTEQVAASVRLMREFGIFLDQNPDRGWWQVRAPQGYQGANIVVGPDPLQTLFLVVLAALHPGEMTLTQVGNLGEHVELRLVFQMLAAMGVQFSESDGTLTVQQGHTRGNGGYFDLDGLSAWLPLLAVLAAVAEGITVFDNVDAALAASSDFDAVAKTLTEMGASIEIRDRRWTIHGVPTLAGGVTAHPRGGVDFLAMVAAGSVATQPISVRPAWQYLGHNPHVFDLLSRAGIHTMLHSLGSPVALRG
jgi:5-enolpyruvylshikimate-3-phosphate synthase